MQKLSSFFFLANMSYFICMAIAHFFSFKYPVLFIYYNIPFHAYQDKIISFAVIAYIAIFFEAFRNYNVRNTAIFVMYMTVVGLSLVNISPELRNVMTEEQSTYPYWIQTLAILFLNLLVHYFHFKATKQRLVGH